MLKFQKSRPGGLKIIVVGCGKVGATLVEQLSREGHDLTIIDVNESIVSDLSNSFDVLGFTGNGANYSLLQEAGVCCAAPWQKRQATAPPSPGSATRTTPCSAASCASSWG